MKVPVLLDKEKVCLMNKNAFSALQLPVFLHFEPARFPRPKSQQEAFLQNVLSLYILYKDFGKFFIKQWMSVNFKDHITKNDRDSVSDHYNAVLNLRSYFAHGMYPIQINTDKGGKCGRWFGQACGKADEFSPISEEDWRFCNEKLVEDANALYRYLGKKIATVKNLNGIEKGKARSKFLGEDGCSIETTIFGKSFDKQLCLDLLNDAHRSLNNGTNYDSNLAEDLYKRKYKDWLNLLKRETQKTYDLYKVLKSLISTDYRNENNPLPQWDSSSELMKGLNAIALKKEN